MTTKYKLSTKLAHFKFNQTFHHGIWTITWFVLEESNGEQEGRCFTSDELREFRDFVTKNPVNFPGDGKRSLKDYSVCNDDEAPYCGAHSNMPISGSYFPTNVILRPEPQMSGTDVYSCMDISLTNTNDTDNHNYKLKFNVIGIIE